jgi:hypothetical protein
MTISESRLWFSNFLDSRPKEQGAGIVKEHNKVFLRRDLFH